LVATSGLRVDHDTALLATCGATCTGTRRFACGSDWALGGDWGFGGRLGGSLGGVSGFGWGLGFCSRLRLLLGGDRSPTVPFGRLDRLQRVGLLDAGSCSLGLDPSALKRGKDLFALKPLRFGDLVNALFSH
jgi:hypothetical protein